MVYISFCNSSKYEFPFLGNITIRDYLLHFGLFSNNYILYSKETVVDEDCIIRDNSELKLFPVRSSYNSKQIISLANLVQEKEIKTYSVLQKNRCIFCGKPSVYAKKQWISYNRILRQYFCLDCFRAYFEERYISKIFEQINCFFNK